MKCFASLDVETDGPTALLHSMRSLGVALFHGGCLQPYDTFYVTILPQENASQDQVTMRDFWAMHPAQWLECNKGAVSPAEAMRRLSDWLKKQSGGIKWVASPACFDWGWLKSYYERYGPEDKFDIGFFCDCLPSLMRTYMIMANVQNEALFKQSLAPEQRPTHNALDDAICVGARYMRFRMLLRAHQQRQQWLPYK